MKPGAYKHKKHPKYRSSKLRAVFTVISNHMQKVQEVTNLTSKLFTNLMSLWIKVSDNE